MRAGLKLDTLRKATSNTTHWINLHNYIVSIFFIDIAVSQPKEKDHAITYEQELELEKKQFENRIYAFFLLVTVPLIIILLVLLQKNQRAHRELVSFNKELQRMQKLLIASEKMASLGLMAMGIAHEINNPLNFIKNGVDALGLRISEELPEKKREFQPLFNIVQEGVKRSTNIVKSLSHFGRKSPGMNEECKLKEIIENCLLILHNQIKDKAQILTTFMDDGVVIGNEGRLHQAMMNMLANAVQAIEKKGTINIIITRNGDQIEVTIEDDGVGIPEENLSKISDPFFTTKPSGKGTGLGLFITYSIIEEHHGQIDVISNPGKGTIFTIVLPVNN
ncbi:MAG: ATP-binding protein [Bacteroidota bacterium]